MKTEQGFTTLDNAIREILINEQRTTLHKYLWYLNYAIKSYRKFKIDDSKEFKTVKLVMDSKKAVKYPMDLIQWNKIGLMWRDRVDIIIPDETIAMFHEKEGSVYKSNDPWISEEEWDVRFHNYHHHSGSYSGMTLKGKAYNSAGYLRLNDACREIQFSADVDHCSVYVEYVANCDSPCNKTFIPVIAMDMLQEAIKYFDYKYRFGEQDNRTQVQWMVWDRERMTYKGRISDLSQEGLRNVRFRNTHQFFKI